MRVQSAEEFARRYVKNSLRSFCEGKQSLNWARGIIGKSGVLRHTGMLREIFDELRGFERLPRYQEILKECQTLRWL
jgi:hypothetical protein